ncbi:LysR family transcriptional regulator [Streptomyces abyssalis]|uniref:LysR family transcriptional regulator n=2 Tax=Streptomyces abyssalis TaxID=933944 RepID=A0A1E7JR79_9ACTN|nr:LysR family transcriptional regulator [Streptomyces abyssalis]OEU95409.1 LysR family transcriptional regulator [Streptomyces abyssalis]
MTAAAEQLAYTPSAVSQQIRKLEAELGLQVLARHAKGVDLTDAGRAVVEHVAGIERRLAALHEQLEDIRGARAGTLRLGTFPTFGASLLPFAITGFASRHPGVSLSVRSARLSGLLELLHTREIDMAVLWDYEWSRLDEAGLSVRELLADPTRLVVSAAHRLAGQDSVGVGELARERWITRADHHPVAEVLLRTCQAAGYEPVVSFEAHDYQEAQAMVAAGLGVALVPQLALSGVREDVRVLGLGGEAPSRRIMLAHSADRAPSPVGTAMTKILRQVAREGGRDIGTAAAP